MHDCYADGAKTRLACIAINASSHTSGIAEARVLNLMNGGNLSSLII
jgi:hypothetical protein